MEKPLLWRSAGMGYSRQAHESGYEDLLTRRSDNNGGYLACLKRVWSVYPSDALQRECGIAEWFSNLSFFVLFSLPLVFYVFLDIPEDASLTDAVVIPVGYLIVAGGIVYFLMPLLACLYLRTR